MDHNPNGILLVDKAEGWTSHDVVAKARRALGTRKVGHAGTLDPMATGLLLLGAGPATRLLTHLVGLDKTYTATIRLGQATVTDDREGEVLERSAGDRREAARRIAALAADPAPIREAAAALTGAIEQAPSAVSAIKVDGRRAYDRVRAGERVELKKRPVTVHAFELGDPRRARAGGADAGADVLDVDATIRCSSGTYVRALARDLGAALGVGGHLTALRRVDVGPFQVADAVSTAALSGTDAVSTAALSGTGAVSTAALSGAGAAPTAALAAAGAEVGTDVAGALLDPAAVASRLFPVLALTAEQAVDLGHGKRLEVDPAAHPDAGLVAAIAPGGRLVGLVEVARGRTRVVTNFPVPVPAAPPTRAPAPAVPATPAYAAPPAPGGAA